MSLHFSANQFERNFKSSLLQNWEVPKRYRERPRAFIGFTQIISNNKGHLLPGVKRSRESPWGTFIGTWEMPLRIPGNNMTNSTARTENAILRLEKVKTEGDIVLGGKLKQCKVPDALPVKADVHADKTANLTGTQTSQLPLKKVESKMQITPTGSGTRTGARAPEPIAAVEVPASPGKATSVKPTTPNIDWPRPASHGSHLKPENPKLGMEKSPLPAIMNAAATDAHQKANLKWPSPHAAVEPVAAT